MLVLYDPTSLMLQTILNFAMLHHISVPNPITTEWLVRLIGQMAS
jgi:hypothetical protein